MVQWSANLPAHLNPIGRAITGSRRVSFWDEPARDVAEFVGYGHIDLADWSPDHVAQFEAFPSLAGQRELCGIWADIPEKRAPSPIVFPPMIPLGRFPSSSKSMSPFNSNIDVVRDSLSLGGSGKATHSRSRNALSNNRSSGKESVELIVPSVATRPILGRGAEYYNKFGISTFPIGQELPKTNGYSMTERISFKSTPLTAKKVCVFCKSRGLQGFDSHCTKLSNGVVTCPELRRAFCSYCKNRGGDNAHTMK